MGDMHSLPSPASSPSPKPADLSPSQPSRKRPRSQSMQSNTSSSSIKRSASECPSYESVICSPRTDQLSTLTLSDPAQDIDSYMAEQGEDSIPATISFAPSVSSNGATHPQMSPAEKLALIDKSRDKKMAVGETWYLVSREWWMRWQKACTGRIDKEGGITEQDLGPVNNTPLLDEYENLLPSLIEQIDVEYVAEEVWSYFVQWYGKPKYPLPRQVIARGESKQPSLELHPPRLKVFRLVEREVSADLDGPSYSSVTLSSNDTLRTLCTRLAAAVSPNSNVKTPYRVWKLDSPISGFKSLEFPSSKLLEGGTIIDESDKTLDEAYITSGDAFVIEFKQLEKWIIDVSLAAQKLQGVPPLLEWPPPLFNSDDGFFNRLGNTLSSSSSLKHGDGSYSNSINSSTRPSSQFNSALSNGRNGRPCEPGVLGLGNMGNTCFMNSALQCLAHTKELTEYFLTGVYQDELNPDNPLGMHGAIAEAFGVLLQRIWATSGTSTSYSPREFKQQLQRFAPQFSGYQQHDSQELVAFLLDGLHEDLNRVLKKPYVEKPDWEGGGDLELVQLAQKSWEGYMMRNDSVIVDLFQGQYQSTLVCPECHKVSITFDPFMYLTLPLPVHKKWSHTVYYIPWNAMQPHAKVYVELGRDASFKDLRHLLGRWMRVPPDNLLTLEIFSNRFYKNLDDSVLCGDMQDNDTIVCFELPCHAQQSRTFKRQPTDPMIVPVYLCDVAPLRPAYMSINRSTSLFGYPTVVVINQEQATDVNAMYDAVVERLQRWTVNARDLFTWEERQELAVAAPVQINGLPPMESIAETNENGDIFTNKNHIPEEGDIADEKSMVDEDAQVDTSSRLFPSKLGPKKDIFNLRLQANHKDYGTGHSVYANNRFESWDVRLDESVTRPVLLREGDAFFCEFDENMKAFYFGNDRSRWEHARWDTWEQFIHPEYEESKRASAERKNKGISLHDCLDEFTKEEKLGEDDLWYCPRCKKHQQATKKFDLWKAPDILVVHLKRFSNSRTLRDKIDAFIDFPVEGLDLGDMVKEREVSKRLLAQGILLEEHRLRDLDEPLIYDLFGVDEHMGGLGGGHYRAYAYNHITDKWYHFDDSYVTPARAVDAVNANAYLLFYRRRTATPLGGRTHQKVEEARLMTNSNSSSAEKSMTIDTQLPTPPSESNSSYMGSGGSRLTALAQNRSHSLQLHANDRWNQSSSGLNAGPSGPTPPPDDPPEFEDSQSSEFIADSLDPLLLASRRFDFDFPDPSIKASPTSSNEAEADLEVDVDDDWNRSEPFVAMAMDSSIGGSPDWSGLSGLDSPSGSSVSDIHPVSDTTVQRIDNDDDVSHLTYFSRKDGVTIDGACL